MAFFGNDAVNRINLHYAIAAVAMSAGGLFFLTFLLHVGLSVPAALLAYTSILAGRFVLRPILLPLGKRWGLRPLVIAGVLVEACLYPVLAEVHGLNVWLYAYCLGSSIGSALYWPSYHAYFAALGDAEHRGHQIAIREAVATVVGILAPVVGAWGLVTLGPQPTFGAVAIVQALSALPLFGAPNVRVVPAAPQAFRAARLGMAIYVLDGWSGACLWVVWQIALFVSLGRSLAGYGGAMALAALVGAVAGLFLGRHIDRGHGRRAVILACSAVTGLCLLRALSVGSPWLAVIANAPGAVVGSLLVPAEMTAIYNLAKASPCPLRFHIFTEGAYDIGAAVGCLTAAALAWFGQSLAVSILLGIPGAMAGSALLWRYYGDHPAITKVAIPPGLLAEPPHPP